MGWQQQRDRVQRSLMRRHVQACLVAGRLRGRRRPPEQPDAALQLRGTELCAQTLARFSQVRAACGERVLLVTPPSPAGWVWFEDLRCALQHIGVAVLRVDDEQGLTPALVRDFQPTLLLGLDTDRLHTRLQAVGLDRPSRCTRLLIPARDVATSLAPLTLAETRRIERTANGAGADMLLSLHAEPFMQRSVGAWLALGKPFVWLPQAASPFRDRPHGVAREFDHAHLSVANPERIRAVWHTMRGILSGHRGLFGERETWGFGMPRLPVDAHARCQAMARVSLAPLVAPLLESAGDLTQRVYAAAASATFQITELSPLTRQHFDGDELIAVPRQPHAMREAFEHWVDDQAGRERVARRALERVHRDHTSLHRAVQLIDDVQARR
ncbi:MAG TPA: glycosyltransferase [Ideonella sp.]|uniref:glycosyltransferase n=1 Tax=Ideonella sp. TaxID=1929293 RepID=UPI002D1711E4|nr:glycosyltransferase [Ideonella sp.]HSI48904.1 glycosyltransferase [Ideonella sp.]